MVAKRKPARKAADTKLTLVRMFAAPRALVFAAWTQPEHLRHWSAPHGFTIPVNEGMLKPGGKWRACMVTPDGVKLWLGGVYREIVRDRLLVFTHAWEGEEGAPETLVTVRFADHPRGTKVTLVQSGFDSSASRDGHKGGWAECLERLAEHLTATQAKVGISARTKASRRAIAALR
ncbi:MAG TPA: SRPBCC domain-containing protein [Lacunisphaera sp.]|nr:SRPBCC domain-containing protein [Lacunisphaera sp.]